MSSAWPHPLSVVAAYDGTAHLADAWRLLWPDVPSACEVDAMMLRQMAGSCLVGPLSQWGISRSSRPPSYSSGRSWTGARACMWRLCARPWGWGRKRTLRLPAFRRVLASAWGLRWGSVFKEPLWRLAVESFPYHGGTHHPPYYSFHTQALVPFSCLCGEVGGSARLHHFWECPVACTLRQYIGLHLPAGVQLQREHIWLLVPPQGLHVEVWLAVGMAAVHGMDAGRHSLGGMYCTTGKRC